MTLTKTLVLSAAATALLMLGSGGAWAQCDRELPNDRWSQEAGDTSTDIGEARRAGGSGNWFADVTTTTQCVVTNPGGQQPDEQQYSAVEELGEVQLCQNVGSTGSEPTEQGTVLGVTSCTRTGGPSF